jgi:hypothetical protein
MVPHSHRRVRLGVLSIGALLLLATFGTALAQSESPSPLPSPNASPTVDRAQLEALCRANATSPADLATCLDIVARVLAPTPLVQEPIATTGTLPFEPISLSGKGDKVARVTLPPDVGAVATVTSSGKGYFSVWALTTNGDTSDLLASAIGKYKGSVLIDQRDEPVSALQITSDGKWSAKIVPVQSAEQWDTTSDKTGTSDDVLLLSAPVQGLATVQISAKGDGHFSVWAHTANGDSDLLVSTTAPYDGEVLVPEETALLEITASGAWSLSAVK